MVNTHILAKKYFSGDIVTAAGGNYTAMAATGGVVAIHVKVKLPFVAEYLC